MLNPCCSQGCNILTTELVVHFLHPAWILRSLAVLDCVSPIHRKKYVALLPQDTPKSLVCCFNTEIQEEAFCKGDFFLLTMCALKQQRKMSQSKPVLLRRSLDMPMQQLSDPQHFVLFLSVLWSCQHRAEIAATYLLGNPCWQGRAVVWELAQPASDIYSLRLPSPGEADFGWSTVCSG